MELSARLKAIADLINMGETVADIGSDHGALALWAASRGCRVIATEYGDGPYHRLRRELADKPAGPGIEVRQGDGLQVLRLREADTVVVAGLGGDSIVNILRHDRERAESMARYIFQPMSRSRTLRELLYAWGWRISAEQPVWEKSRPFVIIVAHPDQVTVRPSPLALELGMSLLVPSQRDYLLYHRRRFIRLAEGLKLSAHEEAQARRLIYEGYIREMEMIIDGSYPA
ncbi:MAG: class I SAM-dependent methyltransferase [Syntrophomonadaceae bacterium]|nr:class I SAM-dependent methyltransferase [Syntrophomonadaceae bacterium]